jgi:serine/threonine protein phosphatase PrpC
MVKSAAITNIGQRRQVNQDSFYVSDVPVGNLPNLYIVADGMGGHKAGDYASRYVRDNLIRLVRDSFEQNAKKILDRSLHQVNRELRTIAAANEEYFGMGTTCVAATIIGEYMQIANVGDSRLYILRGGVLRQVTVDHSLVEEMVLAGGIDEKNARNHPDKNIITRAIGAEDNLTVDYFDEKIESGDQVLICTDGLTNMVEDGRIREILMKTLTPDEKTRELVNEANRNGGKDNITVILIDPFYSV